ncbi:MAG TPA: S53 family peptidase [Dermatophilaceae bacterium]|nr:S53 family peptidase [Dermatophilaceae bacterium]
MRTPVGRLVVLGLAVATVLAGTVLPPVASALAAAAPVAAQPVAALPAAAQSAAAQSVAAQSVAAQSVAAQSASRVPPAGWVTLATGQRVSRVTGSDTNAGTPRYAVQRTERRGPGAVLRSLRADGRDYLFPAVATAYLGRQLDLSLFDLALQPSGSAPPLAVTIRHTGGRPSIPGVAISEDSAGVATGVIADQAAFGDALVRQWTADQRSGTTGTGIFAGVVRVAATRAPAPSPGPAFPMHTLVIRALDLRGHKMADGFGLLMSVDDARKHFGFVFIERGEARVSVPTGFYGGDFIYAVLLPSGELVLREIVIPTYRVTGPGQVLTVDARAATAQPRVTTPRPTESHELITTYDRSDEAGFGTFSAGVVFSDPPPGAYQVTPAGPVTVGEQRYSTTHHLTREAAAPYTYDVARERDRIPADLALVVRPADLATVTTVIGVDQPGRPSLGRYPITGHGAFFGIYQVDPGVRTYYLGGDSPAWGTLQWADPTADDFGELSSARQYPFGRTSREVWRKGPLGARIPDNSRVREVPLCWACRDADSLNLILSPAGDSAPDHAGSIFGSPDGTPVTHFTLRRGSQVLVDAADQLGAVVGADASPATYSAVLDVDRFWTGAVHSPRSHTELSFGSRGGPAAPGRWLCFSGRRCEVLPVLQATLSYPSPTDGTVTPGVVRFEVDAARIQGASPARVTGATLALRPAGFGEVEFPLTRVAEGRYRADVDVPGFLGGSDVDVRFGARDAGGSTFSQTVVRAFTLARTTAAPSAVRGGPWVPSDVRASCAAARAGAFSCLSLWRPGAGAGVLAPRLAAAGPIAGYGPGAIASAYQLDRSTGAGTTIGIVDAFDNPRAEQDLAVYRRAFGLPPCTTANGCFRKVNQRGGSAPPAGDPGWGVEIALDVQAVSAACPRCRILLVEADSNRFDDIGKAVNRAVAMGADVVSNSYGGDEFGSSRDLARRYYTHPGVAQVVSSGDFGFGPAQFPAVLPQAIAAGGTTLRRTASGWTEQAWSGAGSGCSAYYAKPAWQRDSHCSMRTTADVSAVADPMTGFAVYDTYGLGPDSGWIVVGGTSLSAPLIAGMIGLAGNAGQLDTARHIYRHRSGLQDIVGGANGFCGGDYLCNAKPGYDGPTGLGSPRGTSAL